VVDNGYDYINILFIKLTMELYRFLLKKGALHKFKRNWLKHRYYHSAPKPIQDKEFNEWIQLWDGHPDAIRWAFDWEKAKHGRMHTTIVFAYWLRIDSKWRKHLKKEKI